MLSFKFQWKLPDELAKCLHSHPICIKLSESMNPFHQQHPRLTRVPSKQHPDEPLLLPPVPNFNPES